MFFSFDPSSSPYAQRLLLRKFLVKHKFGLSQLNFVGFPPSHLFLRALEVLYLCQGDTQSSWPRNMAQVQRMKEGFGENELFLCVPVGAWLVFIHELRFKSQAFKAFGLKTPLRLKNR